MSTHKEGGCELPGNVALIEDFWFTGRHRQVGCAALSTTGSDKVQRLTVWKRDHVLSYSKRGVRGRQLASLRRLWIEQSHLAEARRIEC